MKKALSIAIAVLFSLALGSTTLAANRVFVYPGQNPQSTQWNQQARFQRISDGTVLFDLFGGSYGNNSQVGYSNLTVTPQSGLYATVNLTNPGRAAVVYIASQDDVNPLPVGYSPQLPADALTILLAGIQTASSNGCAVPPATAANCGPFNPPGTSGQSVYWIVEASVKTIDVDPLSLLFVNSSGITSYNSLNTQRQDVPYFKIKQGTPAVSPTVPSVDTGFIGVATVLVPYGASTVTAGMIAAYPTIGLTASCSGCISTMIGNAPISVGVVGSTATVSLTGPLAIGYGGTGTSSPGLLTGTGISITGSWPNNTITNSGVTSLNTYTGAMSIASADSSVTVTPSAGTVNLSVAHQPIYGTDSGLAFTFSGNVGGPVNIPATGITSSNHCEGSITSSNQNGTAITTFTPITNYITTYVSNPTAAASATLSITYLCF